MRIRYLLVLFFILNAQQVLADSNNLSINQQKFQKYTSCVNSMKGKILGKSFCLYSAGLAAPRISV